MTAKYARVCLAVLCSLIVASGGQAREVTLPQALDLARDHSFVLKRQQALLEATESMLSAGKAERMPTLSAEAMASYRDEVASLSLEPAPGVTIQREIGSKDVFQTDLRLSLPLYTGGRISGSIAIARADQRVQEAIVRASENEVLLATQVEYLSLLMADTLLASAQAALERVEIVHNDVVLMYNAGTADSVDLLESHLACVEGSLGVDEATTRRRQSEIRLCLLLGIDINESLQLTTALPKPKLDDIEVQSISKDKAEIEAAAWTATRLKEEQTLARSRLLPSLTAFGGYSYGKPNQDMFNKTWNDYFIAGAKLTWSMNLGFSDKKRVGAASARFQSADMELNRVKEQVERETELAYESLHLAMRQFETAHERRRVASENYRLARIRQQEGTIPTNRLLEIEKSLTQAEAAVAASLAQFHIARAGYLYATGSSELKRGVLQ